MDFKKRQLKTKSKILAGGRCARLPGNIMVTLKKSEALYYHYQGQEKSEEMTSF